MARDPVYGMTVDEKKAKYKTEFQAKTYYFCAPRCQNLSRLTQKNM